MESSTLTVRNPGSVSLFSFCITSTCLRRYLEPNVIQAVVAADNLRTGKVQRWIDLENCEVNDFPLVEIKFLIDWKFGTGLNGLQTG